MDPSRNMAKYRNLVSRENAQPPLVSSLCWWRPVIIGLSVWCRDSKNVIVIKVNWWHFPTVFGCQWVLRLEIGVSFNAVNNYCTDDQQPRRRAQWHHAVTFWRKKRTFFTANVWSRWVTGCCFSLTAARYSMPLQGPQVPRRLVARRSLWPRDEELVCFWSDAIQIGLPLSYKHCFADCFYCEINLFFKWILIK